MAALYYEDVPDGAVYEAEGRTITETDLVIFAGLTGDYNPLHMNAEFAKTTPNGQRIAHGPLILAMSAGMSSRLALFEGTAVGLLGIDWRFLAPVFIGDTISLRITVKEKRISKSTGHGILVRLLEVLNQHGDVVQSGHHNLMVKLRPVA